MDYLGNEPLLMLGLLVGGQFHDKLFVTIDLKFHRFHVIMWILFVLVWL